MKFLFKLFALIGFVTLTYKALDWYYYDYSTDCLEEEMDGDEEEESPEPQP